jgi:hypothetical protein
VAVKIIDVLGRSEAEVQVLLQQLTEMVRRAGASPPGTCCSYEGVCLSGGRLLLVMKQYSRSLQAVLEEARQQQRQQQQRDTDGAGVCTA